MGRAVIFASVIGIHLLCLSVSFGIQAGQTTLPGAPIGSPPAALSYKGFYKKCAYFRGLPIIGSGAVSDAAFRMLISKLGKVTAKIPDREFHLLIEAGSHYSIIGEHEGQTDLPEYADLRNDPHMDWNKRARGLGGLVTSAAEENILELPSDRYRGECIYIHEFSHTLAAFVFSKYDPTFRRSLATAYADAMKQGLWNKTYSATNKDEYFAEGVQMYYDCARSVDPPNGVHNQVCNRVQLKAYDRELFNLVDKEFGHNPWRYDGTYSTTKTGRSLSAR